VRERDAYQHCPECGADNRLDGIDVGGLDLMPLPVHVRGRFPDAGDEHDSMLLAESLSDPQACPCSEHLVGVTRPDETDEEWEARHPHARLGIPA
jgi:hypothetical protein